MSRQEVVLHNIVQAREALRLVWEWIKAMLFAGNRLVLTVRLDTRTSEQNRLLHKLLQHLAAEKPWAGSYRSPEIWKRLVTAAWMREQGQHAELYPAIDGKGMDIVIPRTSGLTVSEMTSLIEYLISYMVDQGLKVPMKEGDA